MSQQDTTCTASLYGPVTRINLNRQTKQRPVAANVNVFMIGDTLIDAGFLYAIEALVDELRQAPPRRVVLTHHHEDHIAALRRIREEFGDIPVYAPRKLVPFIQDFETVSKVRHVFWGQAESFQDLIPYDPGETFVEGDIGIESIETPGHCPYHCGFIIREHQQVYVLSGDLYYRRKPLSIWHESSAEDAMASCRELASLSKEVFLFPNHLDQIPEGSTTLRTQADWIDREADVVRAAADKLGTRDYPLISEHLYGPPDMFEQATVGEITKASFVRSVLDPVKTLPAERIIFPEPVE